MFTVLHIERSKLIIEKVKSVISTSKYKCLSCHSSDEAFDILKTTDVDLIITAIEVDTHDNVDIITEFNDSKFSEIPILVLTSTDDIEMREKLFELGIVDYVVKNSDFETKLKDYFIQLESKQHIFQDFTTLNIAVLDDSVLSLKIMKTILDNNKFLNVDYYSHPRTLLERKKQYNIYLLDLVLPDMSGENVMLEIRKNDSNAIIILVSMISHYKTISNILLKGADDYILKPFDENIFMGRIRTHIRSYMLMQELEEKNAYLEEIVNKDGLTGLYNHRFIIERLHEEESRVTRYNNELSIIMFDIDHFKKINDTYGHPVGDKVLKNIAQVITSGLRTSDIVGRYGGEEFLVILPETSGDNAMLVADKIRILIEKFRFEDFDDVVTISGGIGSYDNKVPKKIIVEADKNLYRAKNSGRNKIVGEKEDVK